MSTIKKSMIPFLAALLLAAVTDARASTWTKLVSGNASASWGGASNWSGGIPNGVGAVADFSTLNLTADSTVTNELARSVGSLLFGDKTPNRNWTLTGQPLALAVASGMPSITVKNQTTVLDVALTGSQGFSKAGAGTLTLSSAANTLSGPIQVTAGTLGCQSSAALRNLTGSITVAAGASFDAKANFGTALTNNFVVAGSGAAGTYGALNLRENVTLAGTITLSADAKITHDWNIATISGAITGLNTNLQLATLQSGQYGFALSGPIGLGTGALTLTGSGTVGSPDFTLTGTNTYSGGTYLQGGRVSLNNAYALGSGTINILSNTTLGATATLILVNALAVTTGVTATLDAATGTTFRQAGAVTGGGALTKSGLGTLTLSGGLANTLTGAIAVTAGALGTLNGASFANVTGAITVATGASFNAKQAFDTHPITNNFFLSGTGSGLGGWGALNIQENAVLTGTVTLNADATITHDWNIATLTGAITGSNHNLQLATLQSSQYGFNITGPINLGTGVLTLTGAGTAGSPDLTISGSNTFGGVVLTGGALLFNTPGAMGAAGTPVEVGANGAAALNGSDPNTLLARITTTSSGALALAGGTAALALDFTSHPALGLGAVAATSYSGVLTPGAGTYRLGGGGATLTVTSDLTGGRGLVIHDAQHGKVVLAGRHDHSGPTVVSAGTLAVAGSLAGPLTVQAAGTLAPATSSAIGGLSVAQPVTLAGTTSLRIDRGSAVTADRLTAPALTLGGMLAIVNIGVPPVLGDRFQLFAISGTVSIGALALNLPTLTTGLGWDVDQLPVDGTIQVVAISQQVGDPAWPGQLASQIAEAYHAGYASVTINPGTYVMPDTTGASFAFESWHDFRIDASNALFIVGTKDAFDFTNCTNVTLQGACVRPRIYPFSQGRVINQGLAGGTVPYADWRVADGYTTDFQWQFNAVSGSTRIVSGTAGDLYIDPANASYLGDNTWRLSFPGLTQLAFQVNDWLVARATQSQGFAVYLNGCHNCTLQGVTSQSGGFATFRENGGGGNQMRACRIQPSPTAPPGGTETPVVACAADGVHTTATSPGMHLEDCVFEGVLLDDNIAIHGSFQTVISVADNNVVLDGAGKFAVGDPVRISSGNGFFAQATCTALLSLAYGQVQLTLDSALAVPVGARASNPKFNGSGFQIINCQLGNTRSRAIITKADDGLISGCTIRNAAMSAVQIGPEYYWNESDYCWNVAVSNNTITDCGAGVTVREDGAPGNANITVTSNTFGTIHNGSAVSIAGCAGATVTGNTFASPPATHPAIWCQDASNVLLARNLVTYAPAGGAPVGLGSNVSNIHGVSNGIFYSGLPYVLTNALSHLLLANPGNGGVGTSPQQSIDDTAAGRWILQAAGDGYCQILSAANGLALGVNGSTTPAAPLVLETAASTASQLWCLTPTGLTAVSLINKASGLAAAVATPAPGEAVLQQTPDASAGRQWTPLPANLTYADWSSTSGASADPLNDDDHDGLNNLLEYALGSDPTVPGSAPVAQLASLSVGGETGEYVTFVVTRRIATADLVVRVEYSADLATWQESAVPVSAVANSDGTASEVWRAPVALGRAAAGFFRVRVLFAN
jgi:autotransporter-associated beta strand protein